MGPLESNFSIAETRHFLVLITCSTAVNISKELTEIVSFGSAMAEA